jgi:hypothetical protein
MESAPFIKNREPSLTELFADPIIHRLMRRDGTDEAEVRTLLKQAAASSRALSRSRIRPLMPPVPRAEAPHTPMMAAIARATEPPPWPRVFPSL